MSSDKNLDSSGGYNLRTPDEHLLTTEGIIAGLMIISIIGMGLSLLPPF